MATTPEEINVNPQVSPSLHAQNVRSLDGYDESMAPYIGPVVAVFDAAYNSIGDVHKARVAAENDPSLTPAARTLNLSKMAETQQDRITRAWDKVAKTLDTQIAAIEQQLDSGLKAASDRLPLAGEIRAHFKALSIEKRMAMLDDAEKRGDLETLQAVLGGPGYLSGITEEFRKVRARLYNERKNPELSKRLNVMKAAAELMGSRGGLVLTEFTKSVGASWVEVKRLRDTASMTEAAFTAHDRTIGI